MRLELILLFLNAFATWLCVAQTSYNNGLWTPSPSPATAYYHSWTTYTSLVIYGTVTVTITSTIPCSTTPEAPVWVTTTELIETTQCNECQPVYTTYYNGYSTLITTTYIPVTTAQQVPYRTVTSGTIVYVIMSSTAAEVGQVTTNGVVQLISGGANEDANLMKAGLAIAAALLALVVL